MFDFFGDYNEGDLLFLGDWGFSTLAVLTLLGIAVVALSWVDLRDMRGGRRWTLISLRTLVYVLAVVILLEPALELRNVTKIKNKVEEKHRFHVKNVNLDIISWKNKTI